MDYAIIAAGEGSRLAQEGVKWPKPLVRLNGVALIDRLIDVFLKNNATSISIIVNEETRRLFCGFSKNAPPGNVRQGSNRRNPATIIRPVYERL